MTAAEIDVMPTVPGTTPRLNKALSQLQGELPKVTKGKQGKVEGQTQAGRSYSYTYSYADLADVTEAVGQLLAKYGLAFYTAPTINPADRREMILIWSLLHESGEERSGEWPLGPANQKPQSLGSAVTYGRRYCLGAATGIVADDDDDAAAAQDTPRRSPADEWEKSTPARPRQGSDDGRQAAPPAGTPGGDQPWLDTAIERAAAFKSEKAGEKLWEETVQKFDAREITAADVKRIKELIAAQVEDIRVDAMQNQLRGLSESDPWRAKVEELDGNEAARTALEELGRTVAASKIPETRAGRIRRAIVARWPHSTDTDSEVAA